MPDLDLDAIKKEWSKPRHPEEITKWVWHREDVLALIAEVERLTEENANLAEAEEFLAMSPGAKAVYGKRYLDRFQAEQSEPHNELVARAEAAEQRVKELEQELMTADGYAHAEKQRADAYREALEFYADPNTYWAIGFFPDPPCGEFIEDFSLTGDEWWPQLGYNPAPDVERPGKRARDALEKEQG